MRILHRVDLNEPLTFGMEHVLEALSHACGEEWPALIAAQTESKGQREAIQAQLVKEKIDLPPDVDLVVFGSLARGEFTRGSDIDWTLLIDGAVNTGHQAIAWNIEAALQAGNFIKPGPTGTFGSLAFSHDLIHLIGGDTDSNANTTRRILLLIESCSLVSGRVRERVLRGILSRYLEEDTHFRLLPGKKGAIPRFLINDIVRYWRTVAVDYANKVRSRGGAGWALRNLKLRLSRKLIFVSGLLMCLECELDPKLPVRLADGADSSSDQGSALPFIQKLVRDANRPPLEILASAVERHVPSGKKPELARKLFGSYNTFLEKLGNQGVRDHLSELDYASAREDAEFEALRYAGQQFQEGLIDLFFSSDPELTKLTQEYAVF